MNEALDLLAALVLEDGRRWGDAACAFQWTDAEAILDEDSATPYSFLTRSRGASKTADLAGMTVAAMLAQLPPASRLYGVAADLDQGRLLVESVDGFARRTPELRGALEVSASRVTATRSASVFDVLPADGAGAWGLRPVWMVGDELAQWPRTPGAQNLWEAVSSSVAKVDGARLVAMTTAGDPPTGRAGFSITRGVTVSGASTRSLARRRGSTLGRWRSSGEGSLESVFARLFENRWVSGEDRLVDDADLRACVQLDGPLEPRRGVRYVIGLDVGLKRDSTVAAVCHSEGPVVFLDRLAVWTGTRQKPVSLGEVEAWLTYAARDYRASVVVDPWQAAQLTERLRRHGLRVHEFPFTAQSVGRIAPTLFLLLRERTLRLPDDDALLDELANVRLRETSPGVLRMDHDASRHDDRAIALALAAHRLVERGEIRPAHISAPRGQIRTGTGGIAARPGFEELLRAHGVVPHDGRAELASLLLRGRG